VLLRGNCLETLKTLPDNSIDCVVSDPPYELGFMGKSWDASGIAYSQELWGECLRVLKPGGHLLAFGGSRTYHRLASAVEDAGFEIRDQIMWLYGSGFPKSHNISKAIDKKAGAKREVVGSRPLTGNGKTMRSGFHQPDGTGAGETEKQDTFEFTAPATDEAKKWEGWGTALKPSHEPIVVARKPVEGTVAQNVLTYGTGALNIDGSRVGTEIVESGRVGRSTGVSNSMSDIASNEGGTTTGRWPANTVITHAAGCIQKAGASEIIGGGAKASSGFVNGYEGDGFAGKEITNAVWECVEGCPVMNFPITGSSKASMRGVGYTDSNIYGSGDGEFDTLCGFNDSGSAARFFTQTAYSEADYQVPSHDPVVVARKPLEGTVVDNVLKYGTGGLNIDGSRVGTETVITTNGKGFNGSFEGGTNDNGGAEREGRWPANTMITHSLGCKQVGVADSKIHSAARFFSQTAYDEPDFPDFFYQAKAGKKERNAGTDVANLHPTVKPLALMRHLVRLVCPPNGVVLDPFLGSGTTAVAAVLEGFEWVGCELTEDYWPIIEARVAWAEKERTAQTSEATQPTLFGEQL